MGGGGGKTLLISELMSLVSIGLIFRVPRDIEPGEKILEQSQGKYYLKKFHRRGMGREVGIV